MQHRQSAASAIAAMSSAMGIDAVWRQAAEMKDAGIAARPNASAIDRPRRMGSQSNNGF